MGMPLLEVNSISKRFGGIHALENCSFDVEEGEFLALIGPNGAGKSTLFNCITGNYLPDSGEIRFAGHSIVGMSPQQIAAMGVSRTFQNLNLFPELTVLQNVQIAMLPFHRSGFWRSLLTGAERVRRETEREARKILERLGIEALAEAQAKKLSFGQQRLVELARALGLSPRILLLDEPASGLNDPEREALVRLLAELNQSGLTILMIEHDLASVMKLAHRVVVLEFGKVIAYGSPEEVRSNPKFVSAYLGSGIRVEMTPVRRTEQRPLLKVSDLHTRRGTIHVLRGIDLEIHCHELVAVIGPNGAGKSTLLGTLAGQFSPFQGQITYNGQEIQGMTPEQVHRLRITLIPERRGMFPELTVEESLMLGAYADVRFLRSLGRPPKEVMERCEMMYELFPRLKERRYQLSGTLSGGEQQMLAVARGLMSRPQLLLLDEPSLGLAEKVVEQLFTVFRRLVDEELTILLVEQNARAALQITDRLLFLERGQIQLETTPDQIDEQRIMEIYTS